jgi:hypothetical protein
MDRFDPYIFEIFGQQLRDDALRKAARDQLARQARSATPRAMTEQRGSLRDLIAGLQGLLGRCRSAMPGRAATRGA